MDFIYSSLVGYWPLEEGSGLTTADASGNGFDGTLLNNPTWVSGRIGNGALEFDGVNDRVDVGNPPALHITAAMTLAAWVWVDSIADNGRVVTKGGASGSRGWSLNVENYGAWAFQIASSGSANVTVAVTNVILNTWIHVAGVYDPSIPAMRLYTNGVLGGERTDGVPTSQYDAPLNVNIGARSISQTFFDGKIDDVRIHTRALTDSDIAALAVTQPVFGQATVSDGQIHLNWTGSGRLDGAPAVTGPWTEVAPTPGTPYSELLQAGTNRLYRLNATP
jgi:hypothetical protein